MVLLGKQNLPYVSHNIGLGVGRVVGFLRFLRSNADELTRQVEGDAMRNNKELGELREEMRKGLEELESVRRELVFASNQAKPSVMMKSRGFGQGTLGVGGGVGDGRGGAMEATSRGTGVKSGVGVGIQGGLENEVGNWTAVQGHTAAAQHNTTTQGTQNTAAAAATAASASTTTTTTTPLSNLRTNLAKTPTLSAAAVAEANWGGEVNNALADGREKFVAVGEGRESKDSAGFLSDLIKEELIHEHYNSLDKKG